MELQLQQSQARINKQQQDQDRLQQQLTTLKHKDNDAIAKLAEREKIRAEVQSELQQQAQTFVSDQIN